MELDHLFICTARDAPEAERLVQFGLREGPSNTHPGQGTANRRFFFLNAMIELLWVVDAAEAQTEKTAPTRLWERWLGRNSGACPFGIIVRPTDPESAHTPFPGYEYRPAWLQDGAVIHIAASGLEEPMWIFMHFLPRRHYEQRAIEHPACVREITRLSLTTPVPLRSRAAEAILEHSILSHQEGQQYCLTVEFDHGWRKQVTDFRPDLPLVFEL